MQLELISKCLETRCDTTDFVSCDRSVLGTLEKTYSSAQTSDQTSCGASLPTVRENLNKVAILCEDSIRLGGPECVCIFSEMACATLVSTESAEREYYYFMSSIFIDTNDVMTVKLHQQIHFLVSRPC